MMQRLLFTLFLLFAGSVGTRAQDRFCFELKSGKKTIAVLFTLNEDWKKGMVRYQGQAEAIPLRFKRREILSDNSAEGRPDARRYDFEEIYRGKVTGLYSLFIQGIPYSCSYLRYRDKKEFDMDFSSAEDFLPAR